MSGAHRTGASKEPDAAKRRLQQIGRATAKLARHSMKEMTAAVKDCREPMKSLWRSVARAGRNIARDATVAWREMTPARVEKRAVVGKSRRSAA
jgi:hypothetical protein